MQVQEPRTGWAAWHARTLELSDLLRCKKVVNLKRDRPTQQHGRGDIRRAESGSGLQLG